jgi:hypothetical protein
MVCHTLSGRQQHKVSLSIGIEQLFRIWLGTWTRGNILRLPLRRTYRLAKAKSVR